MGLTVYGIPNCDSVKKALTSLKAKSVEHQFHDFRKNGLSEPLLRHWLTQVDLQTLINRRGTTWRQLDARQQALAEHLDSAIALLLQHPTLIKRPVVDDHGRISVGQTNF